MAGIGLSNIYAAEYTNSGNTVTYSSGKKLGKAISLELTLDGGGNDNLLYADNGPAESDSASFAGGEITVTTDELDADNADWIFGGSSESLTVSGVTGVTIHESSANDVAPYLGIGGIRKVQKNNEIKYQAIMYTKVQFRQTGESYTTQGETIEWQTPTLTASLMRDDSTKATWMKKSNLLDSEDDALKVLKALLSIA